MVNILNIFYTAFYWMYDNIFCQEIYGIRIYQIALGALVVGALIRFAVAPFFGVSMSWRSMYNGASDKVRRTKQYEKGRGQKNVKQSKKGME